MAARYSNPVPQYSNINGVPFAGGKLQFFENGTTTPKDVFSDPAGTISLGNELTLDAEGRVPDFFGEGTYRVRLLDSASVQIFERDDVIIQSPQSAQLSDFDAATTYSIGDLVQGADGNYYISITNSNTGNNPVTDLVNWSQVTFLTDYNANETYNVGDLAIGSDGNIYKSIINSNTNNDPIISPNEWNAAVSVDLSTLDDLIPQGYIFGLDKISINVTDPQHDIDFPTGVARDSLDTTDIRVDSGFTKRIDANFLPGDGNGGFPSALTLLPNTTYRVFVLKSAAGAVDGGFDTDLNAVNLLADSSPLGFTAFVQVGTVTTDGASDILSVSGTASGKVVQIIPFTDGEVATGTTTIPNDDTIPQNTEGDEFMTLSITPQDTSNNLFIQIVFYGANSATNPIILALFQDSTADALSAIGDNTGDINNARGVILNHFMTAGTTSTTTFKIRAGRGGGAGTITFNGATGTRDFGGVAGSSITITEYQ